MKRLRPVPLIALLLIAVLFAGYVVYPLASMMEVSLRANGAFSLKNYVELFNLRDRANVEAVWNSVFVTLLSVLLGGCVGVFLAFVFTQFTFPLSPMLSRLAVLPIALPPLVGVISFLFVFGESGLLPRLMQAALGLRSSPFSLDGIPGIVVVHVYSFYVYSYLLASTAMRQADGGALEAAAGLGSRPWNTFRRIMLPELRPALVGGAILTFMASMASFSAPFLFAGGRRFITLQIYTTKLNGEMNLAAAQSILLTFISILFFVALNASSGSPASPGKMKGVPVSRRLGVSPRAKRALIGVAVLFLVVELLPILTIVLISFVREGSWTWQLLPAAYTLENYFRLFNEAQVFEPIRNSLAMAGLATVAGLAIGTGAAYLLVKGPMRRVRTGADIVLTAPYAVPGTVIAIGLILAFNSPSIFGGGGILVGTFWILPIAYCVRTYPLVVRSTSAALERLDDSLMEAGQSFGAGGWRVFRMIVFPLIMPGILWGGLLVLIASLGEFVSSILLYTYASRPISMEILAQLRMFSFGEAAAYSVVLLLLILFSVSVVGIIVRRAPGAAGWEEGRL